MSKDVDDPAAMSKPSTDPSGATSGPLARRLAPARTLTGVGPAVETVLARLLDRPQPRVLDLIWHLPHGVIRRELAANLADAAVDQRVTLRVEVVRHAPGRGWRRPYRVDCRAAGGALQLVFFNARPAYLLQLLPEGATRVVGGRLSRYGERWQIAHPELILEEEAFAQDGPLQPVYPLTRGLGRRRLGTLIARALNDLPELREWQDPAWLRANGWPGFDQALGRVHRPANAADVDPGGVPRRRLAYDELLANQLALALVRARPGAIGGRSIRGHGHLRRAVVAALPFRLTGAQTEVLAEIDADMAAPRRMLRLLQGDVGSGKTLVALLAMVAAVEAGHQAVLMAPTEVLAHQHAATLTRLLAPIGVAPALLTGRERAAARFKTLAALAKGSAPIAVGTHALFQAGVGFADLALAVIDEQHRFGVDQRLELAAKGAGTDLLVMTATPIPRTLVLAAYGDLESSALRGKPPGRTPIETRVLPVDRLDAVLEAVARALERGERLYWVCPTIATEDDGDAAAEARHAALAARFGEVVGLVHGRLSAADKGRAMQAFASGAVRLLVATTVIEVGVDVPEAGVMVIERAERFGLAQLHQLRGRVGRGRRRSSCLLLYGERLSTTARARLEIMRSSDDGFRIAEEDLRLRGPGEVLGTRQSGLPTLRLADLGAHADLLPAVGADVRAILADDPGLDSARGHALRDLLRLFGREAAIRYLRSG